TMCGIGAALALRPEVGAGALRAAVAHLAQQQRHRGPDGDGVWDDGEACALSHRRLAVIDLSPAGAQPMRAPTGRYTISYNGELYNFRELRGALEACGHAFRSRSDTEVLLAAWAEWGPACLARLDGMFAFALWDAAERRLVLARDRVGEKPLYYARIGGMLVAASELRAIAALPGAARGLDARGVFDYLALRYVPAPRTILEGVRALEPGTLLAVDAGAGELDLERAPARRWFAFDRAVDPVVPEPAAQAEALEEALARSIERRLVSDVPLGAFLSSGVDSSLVCAIAARRLKRELRTYCAGFAGDAALEDETAGAQRIAAALGLPHRSYRLSSDDLLAAAQGFGGWIDEPNGDRSCVPVYLLAREMRREVTVAVSGDGGDELFCGYARYAGFERVRARHGAADALEAYVEHALPVFPPSVLKPLFPGEYAGWRAEFLQRYAPVALRAGWSEAQRLSVLDFHSYLPGAVLAKVDRMSMRHALEVRTPFLEPAVLELAAALPPGQCPAEGALKPVLRGLLARHLDAALVPEAKTGFGMPARFMQAHEALFRRMFEAACEGLRAVPFFAARRPALDALAAAAPRNINSQWALTVLGLWADAAGLAR
ncbi:MAG: asparagine synthase (glutamine-hydrolyzing), partial [Burkholderiales bacterium]|nr:asparagine synthase (glutamine-hydrolyzing) [Burkholderiales bacterium]